MKIRMFITGWFLSISIILNAQIANSPQSICPLPIGEKLPSEVLLNANNEGVPLDKLLKGKRTVIIIYRGGWCPYCNKHLSDLARVEDEILALGYQIYAISTDSPPKIKEAEAKFKFKYQLLSDPKGKLIKALRLAYKVPAGYEKVMGEASDGNNNEIMPVPAVFVSNQAGEVIFEYVNIDFKKRISGGMLVAVLTHL